MNCARSFNFSQNGICNAVAATVDAIIYIFNIHKTVLESDTKDFFSKQKIIGSKPKNNSLLLESRFCFKMKIFENFIRTNEIDYTLIAANYEMLFKRMEKFERTLSESKDKWRAFSKDQTHG